MGDVEGMGFLTRVAKFSSYFKKVTISNSAILDANTSMIPRNLNNFLIPSASDLTLRISKILSLSKGV